MYRQIAADLRDKIAAGVYRVGHQLPSRRTLVEEYGCSHVTVREGMRELQRDGLILISQGRNATVIALPGTTAPGTPADHQLVRRWTPADVLSSLGHLRELCGELARTLESQRRLPPELLSELPYLAVEVQLMADRLHQQQLRG